MQWGQERVSLRAVGWLVGICSDFFLLCPCFPSPPLFPAAPLPAHLGSSLHCLLPFYFPHHLHPTTPYSLALVRLMRAVSPGPPSAPQELWFEVQGSALMLHWRLPRELGGRGDLLFNVVCKECGGAGGQGPCRRCRDEVHFDPRQRGLTESRVLIGGLRPHVPYILEVQAVNGVSELSPDPPQAAAINVSTSHAGEPQPPQASSLLLRMPPCPTPALQPVETPLMSPPRQFPPQSLPCTR